MAALEHPGLLRSLRRAKAAKSRLTNMLTQEVSLVDAAANLRRFVITKRNDDMAEQTTAKVALRLPKETKQGIMDGISTALDKLTALATTVGDAEEDDQVFVPPDLGVALRQCAEIVSGLADQYVPAEGAPPPPAPEETMEAAPPEGAPPLIEEPMEMGKALPTAQTVPPNPATPLKDPLTMAPKTASAIGDLYKAFADEMVAASKAGRKIAGVRYQKLSELHDALGKLLNELAFDEAQGTPEGAAMSTPADKGCKTKKGDESVSKLDEILSVAKATAAKVAEHDTAIQKMARTAETPRARQLEGGGAPSAVVWPLDMSAAVAKKKAAR